MRRQDMRRLLRRRQYVRDLASRELGIMPVSLASDRAAYRVVSHRGTLEDKRGDQKTLWIPKLKEKHEYLIFDEAVDPIRHYQAYISLYDLYDPKEESVAGVAQLELVRYTEGVIPGKYTSLLSAVARPQGLYLLEMQGVIPVPRYYSYPEVKKIPDIVDTRIRRTLALIMINSYDHERVW